MPSAVLFGVPQGLILGSILFLLYTADLLQLVKRHHLTPHGYAGNDTQSCGYCQPSDAGSLSQRVSICRDEVAAWMKVNQLQLNPTKTEVLWCVSSQRQHLIPTESVCIGDFGVQNLGVCIDADISMRTHVTNTIRACFWHCARSAAYDGFFLSTPCSHWSDHKSSPSWTGVTRVFWVLPEYLQDRLQSVLNAASQLVYSRRMSEHTTPMLRELH